jgi:hypothetical protein
VASLASLARPPLATLAVVSNLTEFQTADSGGEPPDRGR